MSTWRHRCITTSSHARSSGSPASGSTGWTSRANSHAPVSFPTSAASPPPWTRWFPSSIRAMDLLGPPDSFDAKKVEEGVRLILEGIGEDPDRGGLRETPARVARMYEETFAG